MRIEYRKHYSAFLGREMEYKIYGHGGKPVIFIPCQGGHFFDFENFKMLDHWAQWIDEGQCTIFSLDSIDDVAWGAIGADNRWRSENHERWYNYVVEEFAPTVQQESGRGDIMVFGCSMGGMHAANLFLRRPDLFDSVFAISGVYDSYDYWGDYMDEHLYNNCPVLYLSNMPQDHFYIDMYNQRKILIAVGQGAWEAPQVESTKRLEAVMKQKKIHGRFEYWGYDVDHDWPWWFKMVALYVPDFL